MPTGAPCGLMVVTMATPVVNCARAWRSARLLAAVTAGSDAGIILNRVLGHFCVEACLRITLWHFKPAQAGRACYMQGLANRVGRQD